MGKSIDEQIRDQEKAEEKTIRSFKRALLAGLMMHRCLEEYRGEVKPSEEKELVEDAVGLADALLAELDRTEANDPGK